MTDYKVIDNFLNEEDFNELCSLSFKPIKDTEIGVYKNRIYNNGKAEGDCLSEATIKRLFNNYHNKAIQLLKELYPEKVSLYEYTKFDIVETGANYKFTIHDDQPETLLSGIVYLRPHENEGTIFYDNKKGENRKQIEWKQNRGLFFSRKERSTWHNFESDGKSNRVALVYNLMTTDIKSVCKIEGVNYHLSQLRNIINPRLYRFFKFTI